MKNFFYITFQFPVAKLLQKIISGRIFKYRLQLEFEINNEFENFR